MAKELAEKKEGALSAFGGVQVAHTGFEGTDAEDFALPRFNILQKMSPQCDDESGDYVEGAKPGQFYNAATGEVYDTLVVVPCKSERKYVEWVPRSEGGGLVGIYSPSEGVQDQASWVEKEGKQSFLLPNGHELKDTRIWYLLYLDKGGNWSMGTINLSSTQVKQSKKWMASILAQAERLAKTLGLPQPFMFMHKWELHTASESNDMGSWKAFRFNVADSVEEADIVEKAQSFIKMVSEGTATAKIDEHDAE